MKKYLVLISLLFLLSPMLAFADSVEQSVSNSLSSWDVQSVVHSGNKLKVISNENRITDSIYRAMVGGVCMGQITAPDCLSGISEIQFLNKWQKQGYVFEGGRNECQKINNMPIKNTKIYILGKTHLF